MILQLEYPYKKAGCYILVPFFITISSSLCRKIHWKYREHYFFHRDQRLPPYCFYPYNNDHVVKGPAHCVLWVPPIDLDRHCFIVCPIMASLRAWEVPLRPSPFWSSPFSPSATSMSWQANWKGAYCPLEGVVWTGIKTLPPAVNVFTDNKALRQGLYYQCSEIVGNSSMVWHEPTTLLRVITLSPVPWRFRPLGIQFSRSQWVLEQLQSFSMYFQLSVEREP